MESPIAGSKEIKRMFSKIAENYDKVNRVISLGADMGWRREAAKECMLQKGRELYILDSASGTGDLAIVISEMAKGHGKRVRILASDFNEDMLEIARKKVREHDLHNITFRIADVLAPTSPDNTYDVVTSGFALRNFDSLERFMEETYRVLKPGGRMVLLDVAKPASGLDSIFKFYYQTVIPMVGAKYNKNAYIYLISSVMKFDKRKLPGMARRYGFKNVRLRNLTLGAAFLLTGTKPKKPSD